MNVLKGIYYGITALGGLAALGVAAAHAAVVTQMRKDEVFKTNVEEYDPERTEHFCNEVEETK